MKRPLRGIVVCLLIATLSNSSNVANAGPLRDFFRTISASAYPNEKARSHRRSYQHRQSPTRDGSDNQTSRSPAPAPPNRRNVLVAKPAAEVNEQKTDMQYGTPVLGKPGLVTSPFAPDSGYVDVTGFPPRTEVEDPYTGKIFLTP